MDRRTSFMEIKLFQPHVSWRALWEVNKVLFKGKQLAEGPYVKQFEKEFASKFNLSNVVAVNSGTSALELAYSIADISHGDEVITSVLTCTATNIPLVRLGAKIVFADIDYDLNISIADVRRKLTKRTKAVVFVHFGGNNRGLSELVTLCRDRGIILIEDAAQAVGSPVWGKGDFCAVSLQAIKTLTSGDGGFLVCKRKADYEKAKRLRWFGYDRERKHAQGDIDLKEAGYKYHMNDISAAIGLGNLRSIDRVLAHRRRLAQIYESYGLMPMTWLTAGLTRNYEGLKALFKKNGIEIGQHHYRNDKYTLFGGKRLKLPVMDELEFGYFFVPYHFGVTERQAHKIGRLYELHRA